jgi:activator of 2-hydroxyglutaryl-CoA dehydratase
MAEEFWRWKEYNWHDPDMDPAAADVISAGVDVGSVSSQAVVMLDGKLFAFSNMRTGSDSPQSAHKAIDWALEDTGLGLDDLHFTVGTGYGRVNVPFAKTAITEIACHARGANFMYGPTVRTADLLSVPIEDVGAMSLDVEDEPEPVSSTCVVFAKSEASGLLRQGWPKNRVLAAYCAAMAHRVVSLLERIGVETEFAITGGIAKNPGVVTRLEQELEIEALKPETDTQIAGAVGAALFARALYAKQQKSA